MLLGVSIVICCHNSAELLPKTLEHLAGQEIHKGVPWEVIVVDNASTDGTREVPLSHWPVKAPASLRVVSEPRLGLIFARYRGFKEARYEIVSFIDDDNWVSSNWVRVTSEIMSQHPNVGASGGFSDPVFEAHPPWWLRYYKASYAIGSQGNATGDIGSTRSYLWGAGMNIRKSAWKQLVDKGFHPLLTGRKGALLTAGEDSELCFALRLAGWALWYEPSLQLSHYITAPRLKWSYLRRLHRGFGVSTVGHDPYHFAMQASPKTFIGQLKQTWQWQALAAMKKLLTLPHKLFLSFHYPLEGDSNVLYIERQIGRLFELLRRRKLYDLNVKEVRKAPWNKVS